MELRRVGRSPVSVTELSFGGAELWDLLAPGVRA
jgi:hypothetical protein